MGEEIQWVRRASDVEVMFNKVTEQGSMHVVYRLSLCTTRLLQVKEVKQALVYLYRKAPNLRVSFTEREGEMWFRQMDEGRIDFEVSAGDVDEVTELLHTHCYPKEGLLWLARLIQVSTPCYHPQRLSSFHADLQHTFPHCYHLLFGFNHAIGDGHSFIRICAAFGHILDRVLCGEEVDAEQIGCFNLNEDYLSRSGQVVARYMTDEVWRQECIDEVNQGMPESPLLQHVLSPCETRVKKTVLYTQTLDEATTTRLVDKCRAAKVSLSSCMAAAGNLALVDLLVEQGVVQNTYSVSNTHMVNMRRTWVQGTTEHAFGCYIGSLCRQFLLTPRVAEDDQFWQYTKVVHAKLYDLLRHDQVMHKSLFSVWCHSTNNTQYIKVDHTYNTRGDLTRRFEGTKQFTVTNLLSSTSIHNTDIPWDNVFGTVRGRLSHTIKYNTGLVTDATAIRYSDLVYARLLKATAP